MLSVLLKISRVSNLPTAWTNVLAAWMVCGGQVWPLPLPLGLALLGAGLFYCAGMILNDAADADWDLAQQPGRPIPSGLISRKAAWRWGLGMLAAGWGLFLLAGASWMWSSALVLAILVYDLYHKPWAGSVVVMGACRALLYVAVGTIVEPTAWRSEVLYMPAVAMGIYVVGVTLMARMEREESPKLWRKMLIQYLLLVPIIPLLGSFMSFHMGGNGKPAVGAVLVLPFMFFISMVVSLMSQKKGRNGGNGVGWLLAGIAAVDALAVARVDLYWALGFMALVPVLKLWQRWVAAT